MKRFSVMCVLSSLVALSATAASASVGYAPVVRAALPMAYWRLGEKPGSTDAIDASGRGNNGAYASCAQLGVRGAISGDPNTAAFLGQDLGCYMSFQPQNAYAGNFSAAAWVKPSSTTKALQTFIDTRVPDAFNFGDGEFSFDFKLIGTDFSGDQSLEADIGDGSQWLANIFEPFAFSAGTWYYVAVTVTQNVATFFVNGRAIGAESFATSGSPTLLWDPNHPLTLGGDPRFDTADNPSPENFDGAIDEVAIYPRALSAAQVLSQYTVGSNS
jgi:hypothetical protein